MECCFVGLLDSGAGWRDGLGWCGSRGERPLTTPLRLGARFVIASGVVSYDCQALLWCLLTVTLFVLDRDVNRIEEGARPIVIEGTKLTRIRLVASKPKIGPRFRGSLTVCLVIWCRMIRK